MDPSNKAKLDALLKSRYEEQAETKRQEAERIEKQIATRNLFRSLANDVIAPVLRDFKEHLQRSSVIAVLDFSDPEPGNSTADPRLTFTVPLPGISYGRPGPSSLTFAFSRYSGTVSIFEKVSTATTTRTGSDVPDLKLNEITSDRIEAAVVQFIERVLTQK